MATIRVVPVRMTPQAGPRLVAVLNRLPALATGRDPAARQLSQALLVRVGLAVLKIVHDNFAVKALGGTDASGLRWQPLAPATVAMRGTQGAQKRRRARWWRVYRSYLRKGVDPALASRLAWQAIAAAGPAEILHDTGALEDSLEPGAQPGVSQLVSPPNVTNQVFRLGRAQVTVGTSRKWARSHHKGIPGRLSQRKLWSEPEHWPAPWWDTVLNQVRLGLLDIVIFMLRSNP